MKSFTNFLSFINLISIAFGIILFFVLIIGTSDYSIDTWSPVILAFISCLIFYLVKEHKEKEAYVKVLLLDTPLTVIISGYLFVLIAFTMAMAGYAS
jgi:tetrahydromethanopterin S-methyltransferase subunit C